MSDNLEKILNKISPGFLYCIDCDDGWRDIILEIDAKISAIDPDYTIEQVKEKYGGLRYYFTCSNNITTEQADYLYDIVDKYELKSYEICEICGKPGKLRSTSEEYGWFKTVCDEHAEGYPYIIKRKNSSTIEE